MEAKQAATQGFPWPDDDQPRNTAELQAYLMGARAVGKWPVEQQPDGAITPVDPDDMLPSEAEKDAFLAQIAAEEKRKLDAHDDLVEALARLRAECDLDGLRNKAGFDCWMSLADAALAKAGAA